MEKSNFVNGQFVLGYRFEPAPKGLGRWVCTRHRNTWDAQQYPTPEALLRYLDPLMGHEYELVVTDPEFEYIRTKYWNCRNYNGELVFGYTHNIPSNR